MEQKVEDLLLRQDKALYLEILTQIHRQQLCPHLSRLYQNLYLQPTGAKKKQIKMRHQIPMERMAQQVQIFFNLDHSRNLVTLQYLAVPLLSNHLRLNQVSTSNERWSVLQYLSFTSDISFEITSFYFSFTDPKESTFGNGDTSNKKDEVNESKNDNSKSESPLASSNLPPLNQLPAFKPSGGNKWTCR